MKTLFWGLGIILDREIRCNFQSPDRTSHIKDSNTWSISKYSVCDSYSGKHLNRFIRVHSTFYESLHPEILPWNEWFYFCTRKMIFLGQNSFTGPTLNIRSSLITCVYFFLIGFRSWDTCTIWMRTWSWRTTLAQHSLLRSIWCIFSFCHGPRRLSSLVLSGYVKQQQQQLSSKYSGTLMSRKHMLDIMWCIFNISRTFS